MFSPLDTMWSIVQVTESGTLALTQQLSQLHTNNSGEVMAIKPALEVIASTSFNPMKND